MTHFRNFYKGYVGFCCNSDFDQFIQIDSDFGQITNFLVVFQSKFSQIKAYSYRKLSNF